MMSFCLRVLYYSVGIAIYSDDGQEEFAWQLLGVLCYIPWNVLPVLYILWCHQRAYRQTIQAISSENGRVSTMQSLR